MFQWPLEPFWGGVRAGKSVPSYIGDPPGSPIGSRSIRPQVVHRAATAATSLVCCLLMMPSAGIAAEAAEIFQARCSACHTVGQGDKIGPDLHGVHERRESVWLESFIRSSQRVIASGDATARELYQRFDQRTMPDQDLASDEIETLIAWIAAGGPSLAPTFRSAADASGQEVELGRAMFFNRPGAALASCSGCHSLVEDEGTLTGSFGGSLRNVFSRYRDAELARHLEAPAQPASGRRCQRVPLDPDTSFHLRAFLNGLDQGSASLGTGERLMPILGFALFLVLLLFVQLASGWRPSVRAHTQRPLHSDRLP